MVRLEFNQLMKKFKEIKYIFFIYSTNQRHRLSDGWTGEVLHKPHKKKTARVANTTKKGHVCEQGLTVLNVP